MTTTTASSRSSLREIAATIRARSRIVGWLALVGACVFTPFQRWVFVFKAHPPKNFVWSDMGGYVERAWRLANPKVVLGRGDAFYPPGTHILLAPAFRILGDRDKGLVANQWLWWVLAVLAIWLVALTALKLFRHPLPAAIAVIALLSHWSFTAYAGFFSSEVPFAFFMPLALLLGLVAKDVPRTRRVRRVLLFALCGLVSGLAMTVRPQFQVALAVIGFPLLHRRWPFVAWREAIALVVMAALPYAAAIALNRHASGMPQGISGNAGFNFYQAHCDVVHVETRIGRTQMGFAAPVRIQRMQRTGGDPDRKVHIVGHLAWDSEWFFDEGMKCLKKDGIRHLTRTWESVSDLFATTDPWPPNMTSVAKRSNRANVVYCWSLLLLIPASLFLAIRRWPERWLIAMMLTILPVGILFVGDPRYRVPYDMFGCMLLGGLAAALLGIRRDRRWKPR